jgi:hypothetical protein
MAYIEYVFTESVNGRRETEVYLAPDAFDGYHADPDEYAFHFNPEGIQSKADWVHAAAHWNAIIYPLVIVQVESSRVRTKA